MSEAELTTYFRRCRSCGFLDEVVSAEPWNGKDYPLNFCWSCGHREAENDLGHEPERDDEDLECKD